MRTVAPSFFTPDRTLSEGFLLSLVDSNLTENWNTGVISPPVGVCKLIPPKSPYAGDRCPQGPTLPPVTYLGTDAGLVLTVQVLPPHKLHHSLLNLTVYTLQVPATDVPFPPNIRKSHCTFSFLIRSKSSDRGWKLSQQHMELPLNK